MIRLTAGNDTPFIWVVKLQGQPFDLSGKDVKVYVINSRGEIPVANLNIEGNRVSGVFEGRYQTRLGMHSLALRVNEGRPEMKTATVANAFELVQWSADAGGSEAGDVIFAPVVITSELRIGTGGGGEGSGGDYDDSLLWEALNDKVDKVAGKGLSTNDYTNAEKSKLAGLKNYDDTKLKDEIAETYATKEYVDEAVGNAGGGGGEGCECATPDWSALEGEAGHILNRPCYYELSEQNTFETGVMVDSSYQTTMYGGDLFRFKVLGETFDIDLSGKEIPTYDYDHDIQHKLSYTFDIDTIRVSVDFYDAGDGSLTMEFGYVALEGKDAPDELTLYVSEYVVNGRQRLSEGLIPQTIARKSDLEGLGGGGSTPDPSKYLTKEEFNDTIERYATTDALEDYLTTETFNEVSERFAPADALEGKQDTIEDLDSIRSGAGKGATAVQPSTLANYATTQQLTELSAEVDKKQDTITDLETIRSGASKGATAIQEVKTINGESIVGSGNITIGGGGGSAPSGDDEMQRILAGNTPHLIWEDIYGKIHLEAGELKVRKGQNDSTFRNTARKIIAASFDTTSTDWSFFFGIQTATQDSTIEEIYPYAFNDKKVTGFSWPFSCMPNVKDWSFIKYIDTSQCTYLYGVFNRANADEIDISSWDTSNVISMACENSNFFGTTKNVIGLENWDTSKVTSIKNMFAYTGMESINGVSQWDVRECKNFYGAFGRSTSLKSIDLSKWEIPEGADMGNMFIVCSVLETIGLPNIPSSAKTSNMLNYCYALKNVYMREGALIYASLNLNESSSLSAASVKVILSHLAETPDDGATITFASSLYSRYTAEDKAEIDTLRESAKANGWTIVNMG